MVLYGDKWYVAHSGEQNDQSLYYTPETKIALSSTCQLKKFK